MENTSTEVLSVATKPASLRERRAALALVLVLVVLTFCAMVFSSARTLVTPSFVAAYAGSTGISDALAAALLFALYRTERRREILFAAAAYLINALLIVPYTLTFPDVVDATGYFGNQQSAAFLWIAFHVTFAIAILVGFAPERPQDRRASRVVVARFFFAAIAFSLVLTIFAAIGRAQLPSMVLGGRFTDFFRELVLGISALSLVSALALQRGGVFSSLRLWLAVALIASALDTALNGFSPGRFSLAWLVGKSEQFVTATVVLVSMLVATSSMQLRARALAERLSQALEQRRALQDDFEREHRASQAFQVAALPSTLPVIPGLTLAAVYRAANADVMVGGDWYDAFRIDDGRLVLSVGDVMGSGLGAAVTMNAVRQSVRGAAQLFPDPVAILNAADRALRSERPESIVTALVAVYDPITRLLAYASAGHPPAMIRLPSGEIVLLEGSGLPLGIRSMFEGERETTRSIELPDPSILVMYTDGLTEITRDVVEGENRLRDFIASDAILASSDPASAIANALIERALDDVAIVTVFVDGNAHTGDRSSDEGIRWTFPCDDATRAEATRADIGTTLVAMGATRDDLAIAGLIWSELVGNVFRHAGGIVEVVLDVSGRSPVLHVFDRGAGFTFVSRLPSSMLSESGRGLFVVSQIAQDFSVVARDGGGSHARAVMPFALARG